MPEARLARTRNAYRTELSAASLADALIELRAIAAAEARDRAPERRPADNAPKSLNRQDIREDDA